MSKIIDRMLLKSFHGISFLILFIFLSSLYLPISRADDEIRIITVGEQDDDSSFEEPFSFTVIDREEMDRRGVINFKDLFRYEPGVDVRRSRRYGIEDINIRGLDGNRILYEFNGVRLPERYEFGPFRQTRGQWLDLLSVGQVDIIKGPASVLYGDGALGGVVSFSSLKPEDFLGEDSEAIQTAFMLSSENNSISEVLRFGVEDTSGLMALFSISRSDSTEPRPIADANLINRQNNDSTGINGQIMIPLSDDIKLRLNAVGSNQITRTKIGQGNLPAGQWGYTVNKDHEKISNLLGQFVASVEFDSLMDNPILSGVELDLYYQDASQKDQRFESRTTQLAELERSSKTNSISQVSGLKASRKHNVIQGDVIHGLHYGFDYSRTFNSRRRDRIQENLSDGTKTRELPLGIFPVKDYPDTITNRAGIFFEDSLEIDALKLIAGVRYESVSMNTLPDLTFEKSGAVATSSDVISPSWRLAALYNVDESHALWINYNRSFRAPLYSEINSGFTNLNAGYQTISSPDLKPEINNGVEIGMRGRHDHIKYGITGYYNYYEDFIYPARFVGLNCAFEGGRCIAQYQTVNAEKAVIYGFEGYAEYSSLPEGYGLKIRTGFNYSVGDDLEFNQPLTSIDPPKAVIAIGYHEPSKRWSSELVGSIYGRARVPDESLVFIPSSYIRWDLLGSVSISPDFRINLGILNLFDYRNYSYSDTKYILDTGYKDMSGFSLPGRSYQLGFSLRL